LPLSLGHGVASGGDIVSVNFFVLINDTEIEIQNITPIVIGGGVGRNLFSLLHGN